MSVSDETTNPLTAVLVEQLWGEPSPLGDYLSDWHPTQEAAVEAYRGYFLTLESFLTFHPDLTAECITDRTVLNIKNHYFMTGTWAVI